MDARGYVFASVRMPLGVMAGVLNEEACQDALAGLDRIERALEIAYTLLDGEGYFSDPDYPEAQEIAMVLGR